MANKYDKILGEYREDDATGKYVRITGDTMTGSLEIAPSSGTLALEVRENIVIRSGKKLIFDGAE